MCTRSIESSYHINVRDCYYVFIPGGARKSSSIQLARDDEHFCCLLPSHFHTTVVPEKNGKNPNANLAILFGASARYQIRSSLWFFAWKKGRRQQQDDKWWQVRKWVSPFYSSPLAYSLWPLKARGQNKGIMGGRFVYLTRSKNLSRGQKEAGRRWKQLL